MKAQRIAEPALRFDAGKTRYDLIPVEWIEGLALVLTAGAAKYADRNWEKGMSRSRCVGSAFRHFTKLLKGERYDEETGIHHGFHIAWNILAITSYDLRNVGVNDIPSYQIAPLRIPVAAPEASRQQPKKKPARK